jgi:lysophospholipase
MGLPAPLVSIPEAPAPAGTVAEWFDGAAGLRLRAALTPGGTRGSVIVSPGRAEPIEKYFEVVGELAARGFTVLVHDWRGQGLSGRLTDDPLKGHARGLQPFLDDFGRLVGEFETRLPEPWIALGHSMGGLLTALALIENPRWFAGSVLTAPMMGVLTGKYSTGGLIARARVARWLGQSARYLPGRTDPLAVSFEENILTHDERRWRRFRAQLAAAPDLRLGRVTWGWLELALKATAEATVRARAARIGAGMTVMIAGEEALVDNAAARDFAERVGARLVEVDGSRHEILMETDPIRAVFWREFDRLAERVAPG